MPSSSQSELDHLIGAEIRDDLFAQAIRQIARHEPLRHILEIGSSSGEGSTRAFAQSITRNPACPMLHCMEVSRTRFEALAARFAGETQVRCYNASSVPIESFPAEAEVVEFHHRHSPGVQSAHLNEILRWLRQDIDYVRQSDVPQDGIARIRRENGIDHFDLVLIDGSEFTGRAELALVRGARYLLLDDINTFKNFDNFTQLSTDPDYVLLNHRPDIRNGFAIFKHRDMPVLSYATIAPAIERIEGFMVPGQEEYLFNKVRSLRDDALILEIGSFKGRSTCAMGFACSGTGRRLVCVDTWDGNEKDFADRDFFDVWSDNLQRCRLLESAIALRGNSHDILSRWSELIAKPVDFTFIDGSHQYPDVLRDFELAWPIVKDNGWIALHDVHYTWPGPLRVWRDVAKRLLVEHEYESTLACGRKPAGAAVVAQAVPEAFTNSEAAPGKQVSRLLVHFFTIVLNGQPFIRHHVEQFRQLSFDWHWHVIEGVAELAHDTAWSVTAGGRVPAGLHRQGRSIDGTSEYLDQLEDEFPDRVTVYRKPAGQFWDGKVEMANQPLNSIAEDGLLFEIDADELWTARQLEAARRMFLDDPAKSAAFYWCWFFVGPDRVTSTRNCYANNPAIEWLRTWRYRPGMRWAAHEPPTLVEPMPGGQWRSVAAVNPIPHRQTEAEGLVFQHLAYATEAQVRFKEDYYGYAGAVRRWRALQAADLPVRLRDFLPWVPDNTQVDRAEYFVPSKLIEVPKPELPEYVIEERDVKRGDEKRDGSLFSPSAGGGGPRVLIDAVFFQDFQTGIARVWRSLIEQWVNMGLGGQILIVDRGGTAPKFPGVRCIAVPAHDYANLDADRALLQKLCERHEIDAFLSTYYSRPAGKGSGFGVQSSGHEAQRAAPAQVLLIHDMIPEIFRWDLAHPMWREKHEAIRAADALVCVSHSTARDLAACFTEIPPEKITAAPLAAAEAFYPRPAEHVAAFRAATGLAKPYFLLVGARSGYKNTILTFRALAQLANLDQYDLLCAGHITLENEFQQLIPGLRARSFHLTDDELATAYSGAIALLHPSTYEGFGLPVIEAMACGCPVITTTNGALAEVAGDAALFVAETDVDGMASAMTGIQRPEVRDRLIAAGLEQASKFSWSTTAKLIWAKINQAAAASKSRG